jgi:hypothetical protein
LTHVGVRHFVEEIAKETDAAYRGRLIPDIAARVELIK